MPAVAYLHTEEPKEVLQKQFEGFNFDDLELAKDNAILCAVYIAPKQMASGLWRPDSNQDEDLYQGKVGLVLKVGPEAFVDSGNWTFSVKPKVGDWVYYRPSDTWALTINGTLCREVEDVHVRGRIKHPDQVW